MGKPRIFTTLPVGIIADPRPSALDIRCAAAIALRDGMSKVKGTGSGCYARLATLADDAGTDVTNFSKSLSRLVRWGYVEREPQQTDRRRFTLRIIYSGANNVGETADNPTEKVGQAAYETGEIVGDGEGKNAGFSRQTGRHYTSLREELDFVETRELNSSEEANLSDAFSLDEVSLRPVSATAPNLISTAEKKRDPAEAGLGVDCPLTATLPKNWSRLPVGAQVAKLDAAYTTLGRNPHAIGERERAAFITFLEGVYETHADDDLYAVAQQANRLWEELLVW